MIEEGKTFILYSFVKFLHYFVIIGGLVLGLNDYVVDVFLVFDGHAVAVEVFNEVELVSVMA